MASSEFRPCNIDQASQFRLCVNQEKLFIFRYWMPLSWSSSPLWCCVLVVLPSSSLLARAAPAPRLDPPLLVAITHLPFITCDWSWHSRRNILQLVQEYEKESSKLVDQSNHLHFNLSCRQSRLVPKSLHLRSTVRGHSRVDSMESTKSTSK